MASLEKVKSDHGNFRRTLQKSLQKICLDEPNPIIENIDRVCSLWAGFGSIYEVTTNKGTTFIAKAISLPGKCTSIGDARKKNSYVCEANFYALGMAQRLLKLGCSVPEPLHIELKDPILIAMTKLNGASLDSLDFAHGAECMRWLAQLHSEFWGSHRADKAVTCFGLQSQGTYWYLDTRPDELCKMPSKGWEGELKKNAAEIDAFLKSEAAFPTIVHGDAKAANMIFMEHGDDSAEEKEQNLQVAMYDFQYCGKGSCCKDLAYLFTCALRRRKDESALMRIYYQHLKEGLRVKWKDEVECPSLESLQAVLEICIADLGRWMSGWGWWGHDIRRRIRKVLQEKPFINQ